MTVTIYGAGAIGGVIGAHMARAGEDVLLVDKVTQHVEAMNAHGLRITGFNTFTARVRACTPEALRDRLDLVFLAVKSQDTDAAIDVLAPLIGPNTTIVSLQNGMNPPHIAARVGAQHVVGGFVSYPADWQAPGHVEQGGPGNVWIGELDSRITDRLQRIQRLLAHAAGAHITDNIAGYLWAKQIDCSLLFAQAVSDLTFSEVFGHPDYQPVLIALLGEGVTVALASGVRLQAFDVFDPMKMRPRNRAEEAEARAVLDRFAERCRHHVKVRSGPWRDLAVRKRPTEVDHMLGWLIAQGRAHRVSLPLNQRLLQQVKELERGERSRGVHNLRELEKLRETLYAPAVGPR
ncbi:MAG TPA: ketopantoate reductase family protein [Casimicrobiaceae bacterium]|nr:ketopantoate reductase family protein [Casimicrobiaceae bacterium]